MRTLKISQDNLHARIVSLVRGGDVVSRSFLAKKLSVAPSTSGLYVDQLIATGWLVESGLVQGKSGRPKVRLDTVAERGWFAGIEFNAARIQGSAVDFSGRPAFHLSRPLPRDCDVPTVAAVLADVVRALAAQVPGTLLGIGAGCPGLVDPQAGIARYSVLIPGWRDVPLRALLEDAFHVPVVLDNNLRAVALAERWFGAGRDETDYVILGPRSGFAVAVVKNGAFLLGAHHAAGEIGLWPWPHDAQGRALHEVLSAPAVWRRLSGSAPDAPPPADLTGALAQLSHAKGSAWDAVTADFARVIGMTQFLIDARVYFLHGPLTALGDRFCQEIIAEALDQMPALRGMPPRLIASTLGDDAGALGAAIMAMDAWAPATL